MPRARLPLAQHSSHVTWLMETCDVTNATNGDMYKRVHGYQLVKIRNKFLQRATFTSKPAAAVCCRGHTYWARSCAVKHSACRRALMKQYLQTWWKANSPAVLKPTRSWRRDQLSLQVHPQLPECPPPVDTFVSIHTIPSTKTCYTRVHCPSPPVWMHGPKFSIHSDGHKRSRSHGGHRKKRAIIYACMYVILLRRATK